MNLQPILKNAKVSLRPLRQGDFESVYKVAKDPGIWEQHPCKRYLKDEFETFFSESIASKGALVITDNTTGELIGSSRYQELEGFENGIEIGWSFLGRDYWGGVFNKSVKDLMMAHAFNHVDHVVYFVDKGNIRSQKAVLKIGGRQIETGELPGLKIRNPNHLVFLVTETAER